MKKKQLVIFGTAEIAELANYYFSNDSEYEVVAFTVDDDFVTDKTLQNLPVIPWSETLKRFSRDSVSIHVALSYKGLNKLRESKYFQVINAGFTTASYVSSKANIWSEFKLGKNCFFLEQQNIQPNVRIGDNVMLWSGNHIGHGSSIGDHSYFASHVVVSGHVNIGKRCFIGVNAAIKDFTNIGDDCFIGMHASVTKDMPNLSIALPAQSTYILNDDSRASKIRSSVFGL
jgi:sugar O-acyltransferase (sialic acid O-acetyltransferase NeuD family)